MKSLKKFFALCLTLALVLSLAACAQKPAETTAAPAQAEPSETVAVNCYMSHRMPPYADTEAFFYKNGAAYREN